MKNIIAAVVVIVAILIGGVGASFLRAMSGGSASADKHAEKSADGGDSDAGAKKDDHGKKSAKKDSHGKESKGGHGKEDGGSTDVVYYKFSREFIVPIVRGGRVTSLVILNLNLEADASIEQQLFEMEPKIRDNIMTTLIGLSNDGTTFESMTNVENYESIRSMVLMNLQSVIATGINNVLIVDLAKQEV
jgi:flagellar protein FliL